MVKEGKSKLFWGNGKANETEEETPSDRPPGFGSAEPAWGGGWVTEELWCLTRKSLPVTSEKLWK